MIKRITIILLITNLFAESGGRNSGGPNQGYAHNAPSFNNCTSCHSGTVNSGDGSVVFTNLPDGYNPGETYSIGVTVEGSNETAFVKPGPVVIIIPAGFLVARK